MKPLILTLLLTLGAVAAPPPKSILKALEDYPIVYMREGFADATLQKETKRVKTWNFAAGIYGTAFPLIVPQTATADQIKSSYFTLSCAIGIILKSGNSSDPKPSPTPETSEDKKQNI